jgi:hypothetical protein
MYKFRASVYRKASLFTLFLSLWGGFVLDFAGNWWAMYLFGPISLGSAVFYIWFWNKEVGIKEWHRKRMQRQREDERIRRKARLEEEGRLQARRR